MQTVSWDSQASGLLWRSDTSQRGNGLRNAVGVGIGHHVTGLLDNVQQRAVQRLLQTSRLLDLANLILCSMENPDRTLDG